ncbi:MAG TPA: flavin reductase family protein [Candidatus Acidoferrum sp.]|nr:flavin reductase family protein [Candidatus Acidoferrum sp.]
MLFDFAEIPPREQYKLLVSTITPRPIAWVVSQNKQGHLNAAPFSFFNAFSGEPPIIGIGIGSHEPGRAKDTRCNIRDTGEFVVNLVSEAAASAMNITAIEFESSVSELKEAELATIPSVHVKPPRIAISPVSMECSLVQIVDLGQDTGLVLGRVLAMHVHDEMVLDTAKHYIDTPKLNLIGRMHGTGWYARTSDLFLMERIPRSAWTLQEEKAAAKS